MERNNQKQWNNYLYKYCKILGNCYATGDFSDIFRYLAEDCIWESQWRFTPETGKEAVVKYFTNKGLLLKESGAFPKYLVVEFIDCMNMVEHADIMINGKSERASFSLLYEPGKIALFMAQTLDDVTNGMIIDLTLNDDHLISRIDLCMPELFKFKKFEKEPEFKF